MPQNNELMNPQTLFLESYVTDENILRENARNVKISSPDVWDPPALLVVLLTILVRGYGSR